jgi:hypothetical protein
VMKSVLQGRHKDWIHNGLAPVLLFSARRLFLSWRQTYAEGRGSNIMGRTTTDKGGRADGDTPADPIQQQIEALVGTLSGDNESGEVFRGLCTLALKWQLSPDDFRARLVRAGLHDSRASELKMVLMHHDIVRDFLNRSKPWADALADSRKEWAANKPSTLKEAAARVVRLIYRLKKMEAEIARTSLRASKPVHHTTPSGTFELVPLPAGLK